MATMPDIDTTTVESIAWWNAIDHGASSLDPAELLSYNGVKTYNEYDNGLTGTLERASWLRWRAKTDGWIVVYADKSDAPGTPESIGHGGGNSVLDHNTLEHELNSLRKEASNSGNMTYNQSDVGLYFYTYSNASIGSVHQSGGGTGNSAWTSFWGYAPGNKPIGSWLYAVAGQSEKVYWEGVDMGHKKMHDMIGEGRIPDSGYFYQLDITSNEQYYGCSASLLNLRS